MTSRRDSQDPFKESKCTAKEGKSAGSGEVLTAVSAEDEGSADGGVASGAKKSNVKAAILNVGQKSVLACVPGVGLREFFFNAVLNHERSQTDVYAHITEVTADFINGQNGTASIIVH